jgi:phosphotransferase system enzyme I (PtsI)
MAAGRDCAGLAHLQNPLHPALLELIQRIAEHGARSNTEVSICGAMAAQPDCLDALLAAGIRALSVPPAALAEVKAQLSA